MKTFTYVLEKELNRNDGAYFRLQPDRKTGLIEVIPYELEMLENSLLTNPASPAITIINHNQKIYPVDSDQPILPTRLRRRIKRAQPG